MRWLKAALSVSDRPRALGQGLLLVTAGVSAGFLSGLLGIGGGVLLVPAMIFLLGYRFKRAAGASVMTIAGVSTITVAVELLARGLSMPWKLAGVLTMGSLIGVWVGGAVLPRVTNRVASIGFCTLLLFGSYRMVFATALSSPHAGLTMTDHTTIALVVFAIGVLAGVSTVLFGVGGAVVMVPSLLFIAPELSFRAVAMASLLAIVPTSCFGAYQHARHGMIDVGVVARLVPAGVIGMLPGLLLAPVVPAYACRVAFAGLVAVVSVGVLTLRKSS